MASTYTAEPGVLNFFSDDTALDFADAECSMAKMYSTSSVLTCVNDLRA